MSNHPLKEILSVAYNVYGVADVVNRSTSREIRCLQSRYTSLWLYNSNLKEESPVTLSQLASIFGKKDHSTVCNMTQSADEMMRSNIWFTHQTAKTWALYKLGSWENSHDFISNPQDEGAYLAVNMANGWTMNGEICHHKKAVYFESDDGKYSKPISRINWQWRFRPTDIDVKIHRIEKAIEQAEEMQRNGYFNEDILRKLVEQYNEAIKNITA